jgi:multidrug efflux pump subunit AcrA (membrane-fusion protein)
MNKRTGMALLLVLAALAGGGGVVAVQHIVHHRQPVGTIPARKVIYHCPMHPNYLSDKPGACPICGMTLVPVTAEEPGPERAGAVKIDPATVQNMGVTTEAVQLRDLSREIHASATIEVDETSVTTITTKIMGWVEKLSVDYTGQPVRQGQPLLTIYSPDLVSTQEEYLESMKYLNGLPENSTARGGAMELVESSKRRLLNWDIPEDEIQRIEEGGTPEKTLTIFSPAQGVVLEKMVTAGQNITPGMELYRVADMATVWAVAKVFQEDLPYVKTGMDAKADLSSLPGRSFKGTVAFIAPVLDSNTKTADVRVSLRNTPDLLLKPQMFGTITVVSPPVRSALSVSERAVLHTGKRDVVVIALGNGAFRPQEVSLGMSANGYVQVLSGLAEGEVIVTSSQFMIDAESNLKEAVGQMGGSSK